MPEASFLLEAQGAPQLCLSMMSGQLHVCSGEAGWLGDHSTIIKRPGLHLGQMLTDWDHSPSTASHAVICKLGFADGIITLQGALELAHCCQGCMGMALESCLITGQQALSKQRGGV